jgi:hypothetical protein
MASATGGDPGLRLEMMNDGGNDGARPGGPPKGRIKGTGDSSLRARQKVIGAGLKRLFDDVVDESVPDDFMELLAKFDAGEPESST